jgi:hypothetical protein
MSSIFSQNNNYSATSSAGLSEVNSSQRLQNELNLLLNEVNDMSQTGGKRRKQQKGGNVEASEDRLKREFDILMEELRETGSVLPTDLLEGGKRKAKKTSKKQSGGAKAKKASSKKGKKGSRKLLEQEGGKRKKSSRKQSRELPEAIKQFNRLKKEVIEGLGIKGKEIITIASKVAKHYNEASNKNTDEAIKLFKKDLSSGEAKKIYNKLVNKQ